MKVDHIYMPATSWLCREPADSVLRTPSDRLTRVAAVHAKKTITDESGGSAHK
jgi:hypothetical protein